METAASPNVARTYAMAVVLPTGEVALIGGAATAVEFSDATAIFSTGVIGLWQGTVWLHAH